MSVDEIEPLATWDRLQGDATAVLVDVRTPMEWVQVGIPDLSSLSREPLLLAWQLYPGMPPDPDFAAKLAAQGIGHDQPLYFLCRSGIRSLAAAREATAAGYRTCVNVATGFDGDPDVTGQRGVVNGWQADGLPWRHPEAEMIEDLLNQQARDLQLSRSGG